MPDLEKHIDEWLHLLENEQQKAKSLGFPAGSIPSYRIYPLIKVRRADPNVFFPALIAVKLNEWRARMTAAQVARANDILKGITDTFPLYKSRRGRMHYNFWPTRPDVPFPNGRWLRRFDFFRLPDDIDDTALVYKALSADKYTLSNLQKDIEDHFIKFYPEKPRLYAAWLGDKMPWVTDVCTMINLLSLFRAHGLTSSEFVVNTEAHIETVIRENLYIKAPYQTAPYYPETAVIAYHLAKWVSENKDVRLFNTLRKSLVELIEAEKNELQAMLFNISLMKLGAIPTKPTSADRLTVSFQDYPWFYGTMLSSVKTGWLQRLGRLTLFHIAHCCPAWNYTLWAEYGLLKKMTKN